MGHDAAAVAGSPPCRAAHCAVTENSRLGDALTLTARHPPPWPRWLRGGSRCARLGRGAASQIRRGLLRKVAYSVERRDNSHLMQVPQVETMSPVVVHRHYFSEGQARRVG